MDDWNGNDLNVLPADLSNTQSEPLSNNKKKYHTDLR